MSKILNQTEAWNGHSFKEVEDYLKESLNFYTPELIDLGLPSGTLWADRNVGAKDVNDVGKYFSIYDTEGVYINEEFCFIPPMLEITKIGRWILINAEGQQDFTLLNTLDIIYKTSNKELELPTFTQIRELDANSTIEAVTVDEEIIAYKIISNINGNYITIPVSGIIDTDTHNVDYSEATFLSKTLTSPSRGTVNGYCGNISSRRTNIENIQYDINRVAMPLRGVKNVEQS